MVYLDISQEKPISPPLRCFCRVSFRENSKKSQKKGNLLTLPYEMQYDTKEGTDVFWAYPEGADKDSDIQLLHFTGLHREYQMNGQSLADQVAASEVEKVSFEKTEAGIWFHIDQSGFSPFLLNWESTSASQIPDGSENKPEAEVEDAGKQTTPKTGDPADLAGWLLALTVSGILIGGIASGSRKRRG